MIHTIVIPTAGRVLSLKKTVTSVLEKMPDNDVEVIIVDNNTDPSLSLAVIQLCSECHEQLQYVKQPSPGSTAARHAGMLAAKGEIITFLDDDIILHDDWFSGVYDGFRLPDVSLVGGPSVPLIDKDILLDNEWLPQFFSVSPYGGTQCHWLSLLDIGQDIYDIDPNYIWGLNFSIKKNALLELGGFHPDILPSHLQKYQGDGETGLTRKLSASRHKASYITKARVFHNLERQRFDILYFLKRSFFQGVCDSYTQIRLSGEIPNKTDINEIYRGHLLSVDDIAKSYIKHPDKDIPSEKNICIKNHTDMAYMAGLAYHKQAVSDSPHLMDWITREDYIDIKNPEDCSAWRKPLNTHRFDIREKNYPVYTNTWFDDVAKPVWDNIIQSLNPTYILEIGTYEGRASCYLIESLADKKNIELHIIDTFEGGQEAKDEGIDMKDVESRFLHNVKTSATKASNQVSIYLHKSRSETKLSSLLSSGYKNYFDLIYIDGSHDASDVLVDCALSFLLLKKGGLMIFDDYIWVSDSNINRDIVKCPKIAIDAFLNINFRKFNIINAPLYQIYAQKIAE